VLDRGYSLTFGANGRLLTDGAAVSPGDPIRVALKRGEITAIVESNGETKAETKGEP
jgi:exonuclease VII large subunit